MGRRIFNPAEYGFTEKEWAALPEDRRLHFRTRDHYKRNAERLRKAAIERHRRKKEALQLELTIRDIQGRP